MVLERYPRLQALQQVKSVKTSNAGREMSQHVTTSSAGSASKLGSCLKSIQHSPTPHDFS